MRSSIAGIRDIESWYDIPYAEKLKYLRVAAEKHPELTKEAARTAAGLKRFHEHPRYEVFYEIKPLHLLHLLHLLHPLHLTTCI